MPLDNLEHNMVLHRYGNLITTKDTLIALVYPTHSCATQLGLAKYISVHRATPCTNCVQCIYALNIVVISGYHWPNHWIPSGLGCKKDRIFYLCTVIRGK